MAREGGDQVRALIDAGGLMAGASNAEVAGALLRLLRHGSLRGVVYYDTECGGWYAQNDAGLRWPKHSAPVHERDAFVYFDESRCRGADMQLPGDARAVLTLGPKMGKDKLMQAAGRMRRLGARQRLDVVAFADVADAVRRAARVQGRQGLGPGHVLQWTMANTADAVSEGLLQWAGQGLHFCLTRNAPDRVKLPEVVELEDMYRPPNVEQPVGAVWDAQRAAQEQRYGRPGLEGGARRLLDAIGEQVHAYGDVLAASAGKLDEECERELEKEVELELEVEKEVAYQEPREEAAWDYACVLKARSALALPPEVGVCDLRGFLRERVVSDGNLGALPWHPRVYCSANFRESVQDDVALNEYLRPVDAMLYFPGDQSVLLLSEFEADAVLELFWRNADRRGHDIPLFVNLSCARDPAPGDAPRAVLQLPRNVDCAVPGAAMATMLLFNGETRFGPLKSALAALLASGDAVKAAKGILGMRGLQATFHRSNLDDVCGDRLLHE